MTTPRVELLLRLLGQAYDRASWHGSTLRGATRRIDADTAAYRPQPARHNVREIVVHCAYWKYRAVRKLQDDPLRFDLKGSDWFARPSEPDSAGWDEDKALLDAWHRRLRAAVQALPDVRLDEEPDGSGRTLGDYVTGIAAHDLYHAGQVRLLVRMYQHGA